MTGGVPSEDSLPLSAELRIDAVCQRFEDAWKAEACGGTRPAVEEYVRAAAAPERSALLRELLKLELHYRRRRGERPSPEEYRRWLPEYSDVLEGWFEETAAAAGPITQEARGPERTPLPTIPGYEVLEEVGHGGMGVVYKTRQTGLKRTAALKMIRAAQHLDKDRREHLRQRFWIEAEALARLKHPNIVQIYEIGEVGGQLYYSLEWADRGTLARAVSSGQWAVGSKEGPRRAAELVERLALAVHAAHQAGVLHRDLKAANVLLCADGTPKIADFGLAKFLDGGAGLTQPVACWGRPATWPRSRPPARRPVPPPTCSAWVRSCISCSRASCPTTGLPGTRSSAKPAKGTRSRPGN
jgi:serine/threonine-protein kinase